MAVNVSAIQFRPQLVKTMRDLLSAYNLEPQSIELEVTETVLINEKDAYDTFKQLKSLNVKLSLDDFGKGFSSLSYLKKFPLDILKIDQSFVLHMLENKTDQAIVETIVNLAKNLALEPVAEGVETLEHVNILHMIGCTRLQGYFYSKPLPASQVDALLRSGIVH